MQWKCWDHPPNRPLLLHQFLKNQPLRFFYIERLSMNKSYTWEFIYSTDICWAAPTEWLCCLAEHSLSWRNLELRMEKAEMQTVGGNKMERVAGWVSGRAAVDHDESIFSSTCHDGWDGTCVMSRDCDTVWEQECHRSWRKRKGHGMEFRSHS